MIAHWRHSLTSRTLLQMAAVVGVIILLATGTTYVLVFRAAEASNLVHMQSYITERAQRIEGQLAQITVNLQIARSAFTERWAQPDPPNYLAGWDFYFEKNADGAWRSKPEYSNDFEYAPLWARKDVGPSDDLKRRILVMTEVCQKFQPGWVRGFRSLYGFTSDEQAIAGFDPALPGWIYKTGADYDQNAEAFGEIALRGNNPERKLAWSRTITNEGNSDSNKALVSAVLPVEIEGRHVISVGHDMIVSNLVEEATRTGLPGTTHMIFRDDGRVIARPEHWAEIYAGNGDYSLQTSGEPALGALYAQIRSETSREFTGFEPSEGNYYAAYRLPAPGWVYLSMMPRSVLRAQTFQITRWVLWSGLVSLAAELLLLGVILRRSISQPIAELVIATRRLAADQPNPELAFHRQDELGVLANAFNELEIKVRERDEALREDKAMLESRVSERTAELSSTNESLRQSQARLAAALAQERELVQLKSNFVSLVSHEFRTPLEIITSSAFNLERYADRLAQEKRTELLSTIQRAVQRMAGMMEQVLFLGRMEPGRVDFNPQPFDLAALCTRIRDEIVSATEHRCPIELLLQSPFPPAIGDEGVLRHIFTNLLSNAVKYSPPGSPATFSVAHDRSDAVVEISDQGCGIPESDRPRLFEAFYRGSNVSNTPGTGLGLVIVKRCLDIHHGSITLSHSQSGTTFTLRIPLFASPPL